MMIFPNWLNYKDPTKFALLLCWCLFCHNQLSGKKNPVCVELKYSCHDMLMLGGGGVKLSKCLFWPAFTLLGQNVARRSHVLSYHLFWHLLPSRRGWSCVALNVCPASHQRNMMWPNCVKPILTHSRSPSLFLSRLDWFTESWSLHPSFTSADGSWRCPTNITASVHSHS